MIGYIFQRCVCLVLESRMNDSLLSKTISYLRFPLIVGVVFIHSSFPVVNVYGTVYRFNQWPLVNFTMNFFSNVLASISVPLFFFFSGFLFFYKKGFNGVAYIGKIKKRFKTLLVPYIIWNFFGFVLLLIKVHPKLLPYFPLLKDYKVDIITLLGSFWVTNLPVNVCGPYYPINIPFWFIRDLIVLVVLSPLIWWLIRTFGVLFISFLGGVWLFSLGEFVGFPELSHQSLFFFPLGAFCGIRNVDFVEMAKRVPWFPCLYLFFAIIDALTKDSPYSYIYHHIGIIVGMISVINIVGFLLSRRMISVSPFLSRASFFVYAMHYLFIGSLIKVVIMFTCPNSSGLVILLYFVIPLITILICMGIYKVIDIFLPKLNSVLTGGR